jgi:hypothetical protein
LNEKTNRWECYKPQQEDWMYLMQYANQNLLENGKHTQLIQMFFFKYLNFNPNFKDDCITSILNQIKLKIFQICQNTSNMILKVKLKKKFLIMNNYKHLTF